jgi:hypothetical protein
MVVDNEQGGDSCLSRAGDLKTVAGKSKRYGRPCLFGSERTAISVGIQASRNHMNVRNEALR